MNFVKNNLKVTAYLVSFLLGCIGVFAYSPFDYWGVAYLCAFGLIFAIMQQNHKVAYRAVLLWSLGYFCCGVNWVSVSMMQFGGVPELVSYVAVGLLAFYLALYNLLFCWIVKRFKFNHPLAIASIFTFTEYLRGTVFTGFPWLQFGYTQIDSPFYGLASILGVEGLTFFVMLVSGYLVKFFYQFVKNNKNYTAYVKHLITPSLIAVIVVGLQYINWVKQDDVKQTKIALVQPNIEQKLKWNPNYFQQHIVTYQNLILPLVNKNDVIILPESAFPALENNLSPLFESLEQIAKLNKTTFIIGTLNSQNNNMYNSTIVLGNDQQSFAEQTIVRYNKHHLVPFGEYVPFGHLLDWLRNVFILPINLSQGDFIQAPLKANNATFNMAICYEIIFGNQVQQNQWQGNADYLLTISNDAWFGDSIGPWQHLQMARMRALELGKPLIRATNTGITVFVDHQGKILKQAPQFKESVLSHTLSSTVGKTPFTIWGNWVIYLLALTILIVTFIRQRYAVSRLSH